MRNITFKDKHLAWIAIAFLVLIFILQGAILCNLFQSNKALIKNELDIITEDVYLKNLNKRMVNASLKTDSIVLRCDDFNATVYDDILLQENLSIIDSENRGLFNSQLSIVFESLVSKTTPLKINEFRAEVKEAFKEHGVDSEFYVEIVNVSGGEILETTLPSNVKPSSTLSSFILPLDKMGFKALRVVLINPVGDLYPKMICLILFILVCMSITSYCLCFLLKSLSKQRLLTNLKSNFFSEISHELKRPLSVFKQVISSFMNEKILFDVQKRENIIRIANMEIDKMNKKTEMLLSLAMDDEGTLEIHKVKFDLAKIIYASVDEALIGASKSVDINVQNELLHPLVFADESHLEQVISNLIGNSIKYSEDTVKINIRLYNEANNTCISISDNGLGLRKDDLELIFKKYTRLENSKNTNGYGIGLHYVRRIIVKHGGFIEVNSEINRGSCFTIKIPTIIS